MAGRVFRLSGRPDDGIFRVDLGNYGSMTTPSAETTAPAGDDLLIQEAIRRRRARRSGRSLAGALARAVFFGGVGFTLAFHSGVITYSLPFSSGFPLSAVLVVLGVLALAVAVVFAASAVPAARRRAPWGDPAPGECPVCGEDALRQDDTRLWDDSTLRTVATGTVTLCGTPDCPYAAVQ
jgi:hypothetical protein